MPNKPLLSLVMIVKNEARGIEKTLASMRPFIDRWTILDTGSTDGTQALITKTLEGVPGDLVSGAFVDFATTRNEVLDLEGDKSVFSLMLSGDETLVGGAQLRLACEAWRCYPCAPQFGAYNVRMDFLDGNVFDYPRLARTGAGWRYLGAVHEALCHPDVPPTKVRVSGVRIVHDRRGCDPAAMKAEWERHLVLLKERVRSCPTDARAVFYLAQTHECLGHGGMAVSGYLERAAMGGWHEEVFESLLRAARILTTPAAVGAALPMYLRAARHSPHRAEPFAALAAWHLKRDEFEQAFFWAGCGIDLPYPEKDTLFVDAAVYAWKIHDTYATAAWYLGEYERGERAAERALSGKPDDERLQRNMEFFRARRGESSPT